MKEKNNHQVGIQDAEPQTTTTEQIRKNVLQDLQAAHYLLGLVLSTPSILDPVLSTMTQQIEEYTKKTGGIKIEENA